MFKAIRKLFQKNILFTIPVFMIVLIISLFTRQSVRLLLILFLLLYFIRTQLNNIY
jgi:hypothetical protein